MGRRSWRIQRGFNGIGLPEYPPDVEEPWSVNGRSASAAAAWGWWFVMQNKVRRRHHRDGTSRSRRQPFWD